MIMAGLEFMGEVPFNQIYIHGTVRAATGLKMSKSLGNSIDPLEVIEEMGADALRYSLVMLSAQDVYLSREKFEVGRNFVNKVWNACRFVLMRIDKGKDSSISFGPVPIISLPKFSLPNQWILSRLSGVAETVEKYLDSFSLAQAATELYHFVWNDFCDWYIELTKSVFDSGTEADREDARGIMFYVLDKILKLLHPFSPFITEELWQHLRTAVKDKTTWPETLMLAKWPFEELTYHDKIAEQKIAWLQDAVSGIRDLRARFQIAPSNKLKAVVVCKEKKTLDVFKAYEREVKALARLEELQCVREFQKKGAMAANSFAAFDIFISLEGILDPEEEKKRLQKKIRETEQWIEQIRKKVENPSFAEKAPKEILEKEKEKLEDAKKLLISYKTQLASF